MTDRGAVERIFDEALDRPLAQRDAFVVAACAGDAQLLAEVRSLLSAHAQAGEFLESPITPREVHDVLVTQSDTPAAADPAIGRQIGAWRLVSLLGVGGMGRVYLAERVGAQFSQRAAVKLIHRALSDPESLRRFRTECQVLAHLEHPNVTRMLDGGETPDGTPYIVMEYVEGVPIDRHCEQRQLSLPDRVRLFLSLCAAVDHVHRHSTIHRDIKPANILVDADGKVRLADFGIARVLDAAEGAAGEHTMTGLQAMTPQYASPEQLQGQVLSTATDVYSLGVVLYRLITGRLPFESPTGTSSELIKLVCTSPAPRPSDTARELRGDLDDIVLMALRKEPDRRYPSAQHLADDLQRWLDGRPVVARPDTIGYRTRKFVRRNPALVTIASAALTMLVAAAIAGFTLYVRAERARHQAEQARQVAEANERTATEVTRFMARMFEQANPNVSGGGDPTASQMLLRAADQLESQLEDEPRAKSWLLRTISEAMGARSDNDNALKIAQHAVQVARSRQLDGLETGQALTSLGVQLQRMGKHEEALVAFLEADSFTVAAGGPEHENLPRLTNVIGLAYMGKGELRRAVPYLERSLALREKQLGSDDPELGYYLINLAEIRRELGEYAQAAPLYEQALVLRDKHLEPTHAQIGFTCLAFGGFQNAMGRFDRARELLQRALAIHERAYGPGHPTTAATRWEIGRAWAGLGDRDRAAAAFVRSIAVYDSLYGPASPWSYEALCGLGQLRLSEGRLDEAEGLFMRAVSALEAAAGSGAPRLAGAWTGLGQVRAARLDHAAAAADFERALAVQEAATDPEHPLLADTLEPLAATLLALGRADEATTTRARAQAIRSKHGLSRPPLDR